MLFPSIFDDISTTSSDNLMKTDIVRNEDGTKVVIDVPGFNKEDVDIQLHDGYVTVSCTKNEENSSTENEGKYIYRERSSRSCSRTFDVGANVSYDDIEASMDNGVLTLNIKNVQREPETKRIEIR
jgi:HSP20 family protein